MNLYRVDRVNQKVVPCGMNSIIYLGNNPTEAAKVFHESQTGIDAWGKQNSTYGVILSAWNGDKNEYVIKRTKGLGE